MGFKWQRNICFLLFSVFVFPAVFQAKKIGNEKPVRPRTRSSINSLPTFKAVLDSMTARFQKISDYKVTADIVMDVKGIHIPPMLVTIYFKQPDKLHVESRGFALLPRNAVMISPSHLQELADKGEVRSIDEIKSRRCYHLVIHPAVEDKNIWIRMDFWIDVERRVVLKARTESNRFGWIEIHNSHKLIENEYWLPEKSRIIMEIKRNAIGGYGEEMPRLPNMQRSESFLMDKFFGSGQMFVTFRNYKVNVGLSDKIFGKNQQ